MKQSKRQNDLAQNIRKKKGKRKVQRVPQSQTVALSRHQEEEKPTSPNKHKSKTTSEKHHD